MDDAVGDFAAGSAQSTSPADPGVLLARPITNEPFGAGPTLPSDLTAEQWTLGNGAATVSNGVLSADGVRVNGATMYQPGQILEFNAKFSGERSQHIGFGDSLTDGQPWALFSTGAVAGTDLFARSVSAGGTEISTRVQDVIPTFVASSPNTYRIEWSANQVTYRVDGTLIATQPVAIAGPMRPIVSDFVANDALAVTVNSIGLAFYSASGTLESRVRDAGGSKVTWGSLTSTATTPTGTSISFATRTGNTPNPDASWSGYQPVNGGAIASPGARYIQYRATLSTADNKVTPSLDSVRIAYDLDSSTGGGQSGGTGGSSGGAGGGNSQSSNVDKTAPKVTLVAKSLKASKKGTVSFTVGCPATEATCKVTLKLKNGAKTVASKTVTVKGGKTKTVTLQLNKATRQQLKHRSLKLSSVLTATDAAGNKRTTSKKVTLHS